MEKFTIYSIPTKERPRERLKEHGEEALSVQELLNLVIGKGGAGESVMLLSQRLLQKFGNLKNLADASLEELCSIKGIGFAKACQLKAALELGKRAANSGNQNILVIDGPQIAAEYISPYLKDKKKENIFLLLLDTKKKLIKKSLISVGTLNASLLHPREIFKEAVSNLAAGFILLHNHPSGDPAPSPDDVSLTKQLVAASKFMDIAFLDHIIIGGPDYYSFRENQKGLFKVD